MRITHLLLVPPGAERAMRRIVHFGRDEVLLADYDENGGRRMPVYKIVAVHYADPTAEGQIVN